MSVITAKSGEKPKIPAGEYVVSCHFSGGIFTYITKKGKEPEPKEVEPRPGYGEEPKKPKGKKKR